MARAKKQIETYTVRNEAGQLLGRYRAISAEAAINQLIGEQYQYGSFFRGQAAKLDHTKLTAKVEK